MIGSLSGVARAFRRAAERDFSLFSLRLAISIWVLVVLVLAWTITDKWALTGILAYEVLP